MLCVERAAVSVPVNAGARARRGVAGRIGRPALLLQDQCGPDLRALGACLFSPLDVASLQKTPAAAIKALRRRRPRCNRCGTIWLP